VDTSYHHAASESPTFGHSHDPEKAALGGGIRGYDIDTLIAQIASGGVGGGALLLLVGLMRQAMGGEKPA
jgi:hypothetical protein